MAVYAVGDIQGCYDELRRALDRVGFDAGQDTLWCVGDLVSRGPDSLGVLRFIHGLGEAAVSVLGNHDLHLLALAAGNLKHAHESDLNEVLRASDSEVLLRWLRHRPLLHYDEELDFLMLHAGLPPQWDLETTRTCAREVETTLRGDAHHEYFMHMYGNKPDRWDPALGGMERWRYITNCLTRLRFCEMDGRLALKEKGPPGSQAKGRTPWFAHPERLSRGQRIVCGHWSTLGYYAGDNVWALDSGCVWGGAMTLLRLDQSPPQPVSSPCARRQDPARFV